MLSYDVTSAGISAEEDRQKRMRVYFIMMTIRVICIVSFIWVRGWWMVIPVLGGVFLPYLAVLIANQPDYRTHKPVVAPGQAEIEAAVTERSTPQTIIVEQDSLPTPDVNDQDTHKTQ